METSRAFSTILGNLEKKTFLANPIIIESSLSSVQKIRRKKFANWASDNISKRRHHKSSLFGLEILWH